MDYEKDIIIDESALDVEWVEQSRLAMKYGKYFAECKKTVMEAEEDIKVIRAELIQEANEDPDKCLGEGVKPIGANVEAYYRTHNRHLNAKEEWIEAVFELNIAQVAKENFMNSRKSALENLVKLHGQSYFAGPHIPRDLKEQMEVRQKKIDGGVGKKITRRKS